MIQYNAIFHHVIAPGNTLLLIKIRVRALEFGNEEFSARGGRIFWRIVGRGTTFQTFDFGIKVGFEEKGNRISILVVMGFLGQNSVK